MSSFKHRLVLLLSAVAITCGIIACNNNAGVPQASTGPAPSAVATVSGPGAGQPFTPLPMPTPLPPQQGGLIIAAPEMPRGVEPAMPAAVMDQSRQAHEAAARLAVVGIEGMIEAGDFATAQGLAGAAVREYGDTPSAGAFGQLLQRAQADAAAQTQARAAAGAHANFVAARDAGITAMNRQDYAGAVTQFQQALGYEDDPTTRGMLQHASNFVGKPRVAVAEFDVVGDVGITGAGKAVPELMLARFDSNKFQLVDRAWLDSILSQQGLTFGQISQMPEILRVRRVDAIRYLVVGTVSRLGPLTVSARLVDVSTGEIVQTAEVSMNNLAALSGALGELTAILQMTNEEKASYLSYRQRQTDTLATADPAAQAAAEAAYQQALEAQRQQTAAAQAAAFAQAQHERDAQVALGDIKVLLSQQDYGNALNYIHWARPRFGDTTAAQELAAMDGFATTRYQEQVAQQANAAAWARAQAEQQARHARFVADRDQGMGALAAGDLVNAMVLLQNALGEEDNPNVRGVLDYIAHRMQRPGIAVVDFTVNGDIGIAQREAPRWLAWVLLQQFGGQDSPYRLVGPDEFAMDLRRVGLTMADVQRDPLNPRMRLLRDQVRFVIVGTASHGSIRLQTVMVDLEAGRPVQSADFVATEIRVLPDALAGTAQVLQMTDAQKNAYLDQLAYGSWMAQGDSAAAAFNWDVAYDAYAHACQVINSVEAQDRLGIAGRNLQDMRMARRAYDTAMAAAVAAGRANDWDRALDLYRQAWGIMPTDDARHGIQDARDKVIAAARDRHALYLTSLSSGDTFARSNDWDRAQDAYEQAFAIEQTPAARDGVALAQRAIADRQAAKDRAYATAMSEARQAVDSGNWQRALDAFTHASGIKDSVEANNGISLARRRLALQQENRTRYDAFMADAQTARQAGDWQKALDSYKLAASVINTEEVQKAITTARETRDRLEKQNQRRLYDTAISSAQTHATASQWQDALSDYRNAYQVDKTKEAAAGIAQATKMINDAAYNKKQYDAAMLEGDSQAAKGNWNHALTAYQQAAGIDPTAAAKAGVEKAKQQIAGAAAAEKQKQYADLMAQGAAAARAGELNKALGAYTKAVALNNTPEAQAAVADVQKKLADGAAAADKKKQYDAQIAAGDTAAKAGQWQRALDAYNRAIAIDNTAPAQAGLANAKSKLDATAAAANAASAAANAAADQKKQYDTLMADAAAAGKAGDWQKALDTYTKAQAVNNTADVRTAMTNARQQIAAASAAARSLDAAAEKKKQYDGFMTDAAAAGKAGDWQKAVDTYTKAQAVDNTAEVRTALANARQQIVAAAAATANAEKKKQYDGLMADGAAAGKSGEWQKALDAYTKAQSVDNTAEVRTAMANARQQIASANTAAADAAKKKQYDTLMADAAAAGKAGDWQKAVDTYTKAQAVDSTAEVRTAMANARQQLSAAAATDAKKKQFAQLMTEGDAATRTSQWQKAIDAYTKAQAIENTPEAQAGLANAKAKLAEGAAAANAAADKKKQYDTAMSAGDAAGRAGDWQKALDAYTKAAGIDNTQAAQSAVTNAKKKLADAAAADAAADAKKKQYTQFMADGDTAGKAGDWNKALDLFNKAQDLNNTAEVKTAIANAKKKVADAQAAAKDSADKKKQYDTQMTAGDTAAKANQWTKALDAYTKAAAADNTPEAQAGVANAKAKLAAAAATKPLTAAEKKKEHDQAVTDGDAAAKANDWQTAFDEYTKAQGLESQPAVATKLTNAKQKLYAKLMADGDAAGKANQWQQAVEDYTKAQAVNNTAEVKTALDNAKKKAGQ